MARVALVTVPDDGAAAVVSQALADAGVGAEVERARIEHPYQVSALARPLRVYVAAEHLAEARAVLERLQLEMSEETDAQAAAAVAPPGVVDPGPAAKATTFLARDEKGARLPWALALAGVLPFPAVCLYARIPRIAGLLLGLCLATLGYLLLQGIWTVVAVGGPLPVESAEAPEPNPTDQGTTDDEEEGAPAHQSAPADDGTVVESAPAEAQRQPPRPWTRADVCLAVLTGTKVLDLGIALPVIAIRRRRAPPQ
jgi:hypothetical protein